MKRVFLVTLFSLVSALSGLALYVDRVYAEFATYRILQGMTGTASLKEAGRPLAFLISGGRIELLPLWGILLILLLGCVSFYLAVHLSLRRQSSLRELFSLSYWRNYEGP